MPNVTYLKNTRIRVTPNLSTDVDRSTDIFSAGVNKGADTVTVTVTVTAKLMLSYC